MTLYSLFRPAIFALDAERAHRLTIAALKRLRPGPPPAPDSMLAATVAGLDFPNPIGLAAGFDKDAEVFARMLGFGFGFAEVGTLTPRPQEGSSRPRLFRLAEDRAVINRMGFNNRGQAAALSRLARKGEGIIGVNVGANKDSEDRISDYVAGVERMASVADYLTINISSPNTPGLRALQDKAALDDLLGAVAAARRRPPIFLKVAPDLSPAEIDDVAEVSIRHRMDAVIVGNTTLSRPALASGGAGEAGGLSGAPLKALALQKLKEFQRAVGGALPLIAVGGIESGEDAYARIRAGASLVQLYTALVYQGPGIAPRIAAELRGLLERDGFARVGEAVGVDAA